MFQNSQILNLHPAKRPSKSNNDAFDMNNNNEKIQSIDKVQSTEASVGDITQDLIKQLTLKNKLLNAQLTEYKTLVTNLNNRLQQAQEENIRLQNSLILQGELTPKLHTIEEQLNSMSEITTKSRRRDQEQMKNQYYFHQFTQLLNSHQLITQQMTWQSYLNTLEALLHERKYHLSFIQRVRDMRESIEPTSNSTRRAADLLDIWEWLKQIGINYYCLLNYRKSKGKQAKYL